MPRRRHLPACWAALAVLTWAGLALGRDAEGKPEEGKPAPNVELPATQVEKSLPGKKDAKTLHLQDLQGKKNIVLYFFPKAMTRG